MATVGQLVVELRASTASFASDLGRAKQLSFNTAKEIERSWNIIGTAVVGALAGAAVGLTALVIKSIDTADKMGKMAKATGQSVEQFSGLAYAARLADVDTGALSGSLISLAKNLEKSNQATEEGRASTAALRTLYQGNVPVFRDTDQALLQISDRLKALPDGFQRAALASQIFKTSNAQMIAFVTSGSAAIEKSRIEAAKFGSVISTEFSEQANEFNDNLTRMHERVTGFASGIAVRVLPSLNELFDSMEKIETLVRGSDFWKGKVAFEAQQQKELRQAFEGIKLDLQRLTPTIPPEFEQAVKDWEKRTKGAADNSGVSLVHEKGITEAIRMRLWELSKVRPQFPEMEAPEIGQPKIPEIAGWDKISELSAAALKAPQAELLAKNMGIISDRFKELRPIAQEFQSSLGGLFEQAVFHADSFVDALGRIAQAIAAMALRMLVIQPLLTSLGSLFGATGGLPLTPGRGGISLAGFGGLAAGGPIFGPSIVGEKGPEVFIPGTPGTIIPNDKAFGNKARSVVNHFHFNGVTDADSFKRSKGQIAAFLQRQMAIAGARNG